MKLTMHEWGERYATNSGGIRYNRLGFFTEPHSTDVVSVVLPCACGDDDCEGWAAVLPSGVHHHLMFDAPDNVGQVLRDAKFGRLALAEKE